MTTYLPRSTFSLADSVGKPYVAVVACDTAGIGGSAVRALAATLADREDEEEEEEDMLRVYIVGRNEGAERNIVVEFSEACPQGMFRFHEGNMSLLREVDRVCADITRIELQEASVGGRVAKIDFLVSRQGVLSLAAEDTPRNYETKNEQACS
ncbi:hypothetical protein F4814DRAFT_84675 [Daldinia grandis]|nr:hypothetical protein F4814DRAFT_84675 [Daldinia grandis]